MEKYYRFRDLIGAYFEIKKMNSKQKAVFASHEMVNYTWTFMEQVAHEIYLKRQESRRSGRHILRDILFGEEDGRRLG